VNVTKEKRGITMKVLSGFKNVLILAVILIFWPIRKTHAYIDPGTGSYIIQVMIGGLLGAAFALKVYWKKVKAYFSNLLSKRTKNDKHEN
jgi:glucan phosphoethanolaminetransferase (alkaline phosphatase superfamily)